MRLLCATTRVAPRAPRGAWQGEILNRRKNGEEYAELLNISAVRGKKRQRPRVPNSW